MEINDLKIGQKLNNDELCEIFGCSSQGGMRRSTSTGTLVLVSNHVRSIYDDRWEGDVVHYTGMGTNGDQSLGFMQNKTLYESGQNDVSVHLFEVFKIKEYTYSGQVELAGEPYTEKQPDENGDLRKVYVFPLRLKAGGAPVFDVEEVKASYNVKERTAKRLSDKEVEARAKAASGKGGFREVVSKQYGRDPWVAEQAKREAGGVCQLCEQPAPFINRNGEPFLETHHIEWLAKGGKDSIQNTVALCPNCHRRMHALDDSSDVEKLKTRKRD